MSRAVAKCGTDGGYFRHRRVLKNEPCADCRAAHAAATLRKKGGRRRNAAPKAPAPKKTCACGQVMAAQSKACWRCNKQAALARKRGDYYDPEDDPKCPVSWIRRGPIWHPVYEDSEVA